MMVVAGDALALPLLLGTISVLCRLRNALCIPVPLL